MLRFFEQRRRVKRRIYVQVERKALLKSAASPSMRGFFIKLFVQPAPNKAFH